MVNNSLGIIPGGAIAQLAERRVRIAEVESSSLFRSKTYHYGLVSERVSLTRLPFKRWSFFGELLGLLGKTSRLIHSYGDPRHDRGPSAHASPRMLPVFFGKPFDHSLRAAVHSMLSIETLEVRPDGALGDTELMPDLFVREAGSDQF